MHLTSVAIQLEQMTVILETAYLNGYDAGYGVGYNIGYGDGERDSNLEQEDKLVDKIQEGLTVVADNMRLRGLIEALPSMNEDELHHEYGFMFLPGALRDALAALLREKQAHVSCNTSVGDSDPNAAS